MSINDNPLNPEEEINIKITEQQEYDNNDNNESLNNITEQPSSFFYMLSVSFNDGDTEKEYLFFTKQGSIMIWDKRDKVNQVLGTIGLSLYKETLRGWILKIPIDLNKGLEDLNFDFLIKDWLVGDISSGSLPFKEIPIFYNNLFLEVDSLKTDTFKIREKPKSSLIL